jgi:tetratricopeptide (TPR) repeat protein
MVRLRCPECGYLQTLSEERFLSISDDYLTCPHCHAHVPKQWEPDSEEAVPDEVRHKMHAFSRRILNGGNATREVVHALESLVRRHGPVEESDKALGVGYAYIGETRKAEAFLIQALRQNPYDAEALHWLMEILMCRKKHKEAVEVGRAIIDILGHRTSDEDVAFLAIALSDLNRKDEALALLDSFPDLDPRNQIVKQARKELTRGAAFGLAGLFRETGRLHRLLRG